MGDPAGIGPDLALEAWHRRKDRAVPPFVFLGDPDLLSNRAAELELDVPIACVGAPETAPARWAEALPVAPAPLSASVGAGLPDAAAGPAVVGAIARGVDMIRNGTARALVTNPINKHVLYQSGFRHSGHTDYLADLSAPWNVAPRPVMMLASDELRVVPATIHLPLSEVPGALTSQLVEETVVTTAHGLRDWFGIAAPRIAVTGLNPHAGERGSLGREECEIITPVIRRLQMDGLRVSGPHPADAMFHAEARRTYDAAVAMYHDQALLPIKTLDFDHAVNLTLGLPFVRTSPCHGTAYELAGTGRARPDSLVAALRLAQVICERRERAA